MRRIFLCFFFISQRKDHVAEGMAEEEQAQSKGGHFRDGKRPPYRRHPSGEGEKIGGRQQHHQLADDGHDHAQHAVAQSLEGGGADDIKPCEGKTQTDDPQGRHAIMIPTASAALNHTASVSRLRFRAPKL